MSLQDLKEQVAQLPAKDQLELVSTIIQSLQGEPQLNDWQFLVARPHPWRKQLFIKGRKLLASSVWRDMLANGMTPEQAANNWDLPLVVIQEAIQYCETHQELLMLEAEEERHRLQEKGVSLEPSPAA
ncbi:hypothetical protein C7293_30165 [filamentous cyanobacterium CCT1]|nr:hypothetical protein C7293_30165 [filamentous cyanobacterium CCT1]PSN77953.1 hypothetical protein C8B47_19380 [filamentous cyanobacterium CCP4]